MTVSQISPKEALELLKNDKNSVLIDVRTFEEIHFVGFVDPESFDSRMVLLPWQIFPDMQINPEFAEGLDDAMKNFFADKAQEAKIIFICRTGGRSNAAANHAINLGYKNCFNLSSGFEGDLDKDSHRGQINGWKADTLPWRQK